MLVASVKSLVYIFDLQPSETERGAWDGILVKQWIDEDGSGEGEYYIFDTYKDEDAFDVAVDKIMADAEKLVARENVDAFLAVIDILKELAIVRGTMSQQFWIGKDYSSMAQKMRIACMNLAMHRGCTIMSSAMMNVGICILHRLPMPSNKPWAGIICRRLSRFD